jgi:4-hydroxy-tetrahydrodipicolinate reductase
MENNRGPLSIALIGYGKMGKAIEEIAIEQGHDICLKISRDNIQDFNKENVSPADVAIEFTGPETAFMNVKSCIEWGVPVVCGSTGWTKEINVIRDLCNKKNGAFLFASNFSVGVNIFFELNERLARLMSGRNDYTLSLEEIHHTQKKDAPSGTAITLAEGIISHHEGLTGWEKETASTEKVIPIISKRIDPAPGTHKVLYSSAIDDIEIIHTAHNRKGFAKGAVLAAEFLRGKNGNFSMKDVLGL